MKLPHSCHTPRNTSRPDDPSVLLSEHYLTTVILIHGARGCQRSSFSVVQRIDASIIFSDHCKSNHPPNVTCSGIDHSKGELSCYCSIVRIYHPCFRMDRPNLGSQRVSRLPPWHCHLIHLLFDRWAWGCKNKPANPVQGES